MIPCGHLQIKQYKSYYTAMNLFVLTHWATKLKNVKFLPFTLYYATYQEKNVQC